MHVPPRALRVDTHETGMRLDVLLAAKLDLSRAQIRRLLARGAVCVSGRSVGLAAKGERLAAGTAIEVAPFTRPEHQRIPTEPERPLEVLAEGSGWVALDKPAGIPVHPLKEGETGTLLGALCARRPELDGVGEGGLASGVVHRLDVDTSGALLVATEQPAWERLRSAFKEHRVEKVYRAIVHGHPEGAGSVEVGLVTARHRPARVRVVEDEERSRARGVRMAALRWQVLESFDAFSLVEVRPRTGHLHQIRVTLAHLGTPIAGDATYGPREDRSAAPRQMLHAAQVGFAEIEASSPDPADFAQQLEGLRGLAR